MRPHGTALKKPEHTIIGTMVVIDSARFGELKIDGKVYYSDMIVWWDGEREFMPKTHMFTMPLFARLLRRNPQMVVLGRGHQQSVKVAGDVRAKAKDKGIKLFEDSSDKAADIFNGLIAQKKKAVAYIHTTG
jgi:hypothetical protein